MLCAVLGPFTQVKVGDIVRNIVVYFRSPNTLGEQVNHFADTQVASKCRGVKLVENHLTQTRSGRQHKLGLGVV